ncbi:MAG: hypothetical protein KIS76_14000 [Pyrinomonadaceae bacterium]|nr:hypothetical protein [Pyrinomonadaceae bacterium]
MRKAKSVAIIGACNFGAEDLYSLLTDGGIDELILVDDVDGISNELNSILHSMPIGRTVKIRQGTSKDAACSDIVVLANAVRTSQDKSLYDSLVGNAIQVHNTADELRLNGFKSVLIVAVEPVDLLAKVALNASRIPARQVIGSGRSSGEYFDAAEKRYVSAAVWCAARRSAVSSIENCDPNCPGFDSMLVEDRAKPVAAAREITFGQLFSVGSCIPVICRSILKSERTILPVSAYLTGQYGISNVFMNQPCVISGSGVEKVIELKIEPEERLALASSAAKLRRFEDDLNRSIEVKKPEKLYENNARYRRVGT